MKKLLFRASIISLIICLFIASKVYAIDNFTVQFQDGLRAKAGEVIDVPITISGFKFDESVERGLIAFSCKLEYDTDDFELVGTTASGSTRYVFFPEEISEYIEQSVFDKDSGRLVVQIKASAFENGDGYLDKYTEIAYIQLRANEGIYSGFYPIAITDVEGGNKETTTSVAGTESRIYVDGIEREEQEEDNRTSQTRNIGTTTNLEAESVIAQIKQNAEGNKIIVTVDEINGLAVSKVVVNNKELEKENGSFVMDAEAGELYQFLFYDEADSLIGIQIYVVDGENSGDNEGSGTSDRKITGMSGYSSSADDTEEEEKTTTIKEAIKNVLTGDSITLWIVLAIVVDIAAIVVVLIKRKVNK